MPPKCATDTLDNPLWQFALGIYAHTEVQQRLLQLQDEHSADVLLLLLQLWLHQRGDGWPDAELPSRYLLWREQMIWPLRRLRRQLDKTVPLRASLQQVEIEAEQQGLAYLWQWLALQERSSTALAQCWQVGCATDDVQASERIQQLLVVAEQASN
ncbi:TIGR02444 family protein [Bacterioplanes sanyensis]|nr:TIGR02444 family protein [Bacterioplanes sanyensis]